MKTHTELIHATRGVIAAAALMLNYAGYSQGTVVFWNYSVTGSTTSTAPGAVYAPIYREDPADRTHRISGNASNAFRLPGTTSYNGASFVDGNQGVAFVVTLWGRLSTAVGGTAEQNNLELLDRGITTFRTDAGPAFRGIWIPLMYPVPVPGVMSDTDRATFQVRVWDTRSGTINSWDALSLAENNNVLRGYSDLFTVPWPLGIVDPPNVSPYLQGLESFNLFVVSQSVPEPSVVVLGMLGAACLIFCRPRK